MSESTGLDFRFEWLDPLGAKIAEHRATWASLRISVGGEVVSRAEDLAVKSVRESLFLPLYPLAEWLAQHWWSLLHEPNTLSRSASTTFFHRHSLRFAGEGFALPDLSIEPKGASVLLSWRPRRLEHFKVDLPSRGSQELEADALEESLGSFIEAVVQRLEQNGIRETLLQQDWAAIEAARGDDDERTFCSVAASLGLDPFDLEESEIDVLEKTYRELPPSLNETFFQAADFSRLAQQFSTLTETLDRLENTESEALSLLELRGLFSPRGASGVPWRDGYSWARQLRKHLSAETTLFDTFEALSGALEIPPSTLEPWRSRVDSVDLFDALVAFNRRESPSFALDRRREEHQRFALCRGLFEVLSSPSDTPLLVTRARTEQQTRNRAFAAELLAPAHLLRERVSGPIVESEELDDLAQAFGVSPSVIQHQLQNHDLAQTVGAAA